MAAAGGVRPRRGRDLQGRYLSFAEREEIALSSARGESMRCIARRLGRSPATISRELRRNADRDGGYRATTAHAGRAHHRLRDADRIARGLQARASSLPALATKIQTLPEALRRTLTSDQGPEMRDWKQIAVDAGIQVYFCDPHAPWQRGTNENTNGLLRQYFPKGFDFATVTEADLDKVADELNDRPRKRLDFYKPLRAHRRAVRPPRGRAT